MKNETIKKLKIGDVFVLTWSYEQTNVNFFQIIDFKGKKTVVLKRIESNKNYDNYDFSMAGTATPRLGAFYDDQAPFIRRIIDVNGEPAVKIFQDMRNYAYLHEEGKSYYFSEYH